MRYLIFIFLIFFSSISIAQPVVPENCILKRSFAGNDQAQCSGYSSAIAGDAGVNLFFNSPAAGLTCDIKGYGCANPCFEGQVYNSATKSCSCPAGTKSNTVFSGGKGTISCIPDEPVPAQCQPPRVEYMGLCRDGVPKPEDCADKPTAVFVGGVYMCTDDENCGDGTTPTILTTAQGSWKVCGGSGSASSSGGANSSSPAQSSASNTSDSNTSSGSGGGNGGENGSGNNTSGGASSASSGGGGGGPITQSSSSTSSGAHGAASSGSGAGNCDPTAHDYLACISRENPGEGDGGSGFYEPSGGKGSFDGEAAEAKKKELEQEIKNEIEKIKDEITEHMGGEIRGSGGLSDKCEFIFQKQVCFGVTKWQTQLSVIGNVVFFIACFTAFAIVLRN